METNKRLENIEELLISTGKQNRRLMAIVVVLAILLLLFVAIFAVGFLALNQTVSQATGDLPLLIQTATQSVQESSTQLNIALADIQSIDFAGLNSAIRGIESGVGSVDFVALNRSILDLQIASQRLAAIMSIFG